MSYKLRATEIKWAVSSYLVTGFYYLVVTK